MPKHNFLKAGIIAFALVWLGLSVFALLYYPGSKLIYSVFSIVFLGMLVVGFYRQDSYGYMFLTVFMWLGFWLKFTVRMISGPAYGEQIIYGEPIGAFIPTPGNLDNVLIIAILASFGIIAAGFFGRYIPKGGAYCCNTQNTCPRWYPRSRRWLWLCLWLCIVLIPVVNMVFGIAQIGLVPRNVFYWPLNFLIAWFLGIGLSMAVVTLLWWDISAIKNPAQGLLAALAEAAVSSMSLLSRGTFLWHVLPVAATLSKNAKKLLPTISKRKIFAVAGATALMFVISFAMVNTMRRYFYSEAVISGLPSKSDNAYSLTLVARGFSDEFAGSLKNVYLMAVGRWIGVEGVMAVYAYPIKGRDTLFNALLEKRKIGKADFYQSVSLSGISDSLHSQFGFLPGPAAFFYYSGSRVVVFFGILLLALAVKFSETAVAYLTGNPFMCSLWGIAAANTIAQLSVPRQMLPYFSAIICALLFIRLLHSRPPQII